MIIIEILLHSCFLHEKQAKMEKNAMKTCLKVAFILIFFETFFVRSAFAVKFPTGHANVDVSAAVGQFYVSLSGFIAPFASVVLTSDGQVLRSVAADAAGNFSISQVLVKQGFNHFCLDAVDVKRLGQSEACFIIPPVTGDFVKNNIFLPPTIGLFRTQISAGSNAVIWGYSMPGALVTVHASDGKTYTATAGTDGFYQITAYIAKAGTYEMYADAVYKKQNSEKPTNKVTLIALTLAEQVNQNVSNWLKKLLTFLFNLPLGPLWLAIPIIILIYILYRKLRGLPIIPTWGKPGTGKTFAFDYLFRPRKLHHSWMKGIGF